MGGLIRPAIAVVAVALASGLVSAQEPFKAKPAAAEPERWLAEASAAEQSGKFEKALDLYLRAYLAGQNSPALREHIHFCLRNVRQDERHRDAAFQKFVLALPAADAITLYSEAIESIHKHYAVREQAGVEGLVVAGLDELDRALGEPAFRQTHLPDVTEQKLAKFRQSLRGLRAKPPTTTREAQLAAREVVALAQKQLGIKNGSAFVLELLCGACSGLDEYTQYVSPAHPQSHMTSPMVELAGYGILVAFDAKGLSVEAVLPGSWAATHTALQKGNLIVRLNGKPMARVTAATLLDAFRTPGMGGHELELDPTMDEMTASIVRLPNPMPTVYAAEMVKDGVGYLRMSAFREQTPGELESAVAELKGRGMRVLVLDLRGNTGGLFTAAVECSKLFLPAGIVATTQGQVPDFSNRVFSSEAGMTATDLPLILLVDTGTMSSAEVFAAGLKDNQRATLVGLPTFGKGLVQSPVPLRSLDTPQEPSKSGSLVLSVARVFGPRGDLIQGAGVAPHVHEPNADRQLTLAIDKGVSIAGGMRSGMMR